MAQQLLLHRLVLARTRFQKIWQLAHCWKMEDRDKDDYERATCTRSL